ncbi:ABC transporter family substrate-binding protein [Streptomyces hesseae]|uniref:ABC transporter family substrate-binding protein n=1 Tax=Streptomyces hesseae TaxID=3075519 RepID=A0ABU2T0W1_9ACTN|nr:ABC transporter family substrate-binding protein [Streptomyces sp. DSM 40473]MDT0453839.1 ABC transporter family substrate-binding protein [Streptomyces sp. DSM 40473]
MPRVAPMSSPPSPPPGAGDADRPRRARRPRRPRRGAVLLVAAVLLPLPLLAGCSGGGGEEDDAEGPPAPRDIATVPRAKVADRSTLTWAVDALPATYNAFQADADAATQRVAGAVLPTLFTLDERGRPQRDPDYLVSAAVTQRRPRQVVVYKLNPKAVWGDGNAITAADFEAQWKALRGKDSAFWAAHNAGYDRIDRVERGANDREVKVTFAKSLADWPALFTPLYPKSVMAGGAGFNDSLRKEAPQAAGPFQIAARDDKQGTLTLARNPRWWGDRARLEKLVFRAVPREQRVEALASGKADLAELTPAAAERIMKVTAAPKEKSDKDGRSPGLTGSRTPVTPPAGHPSVVGSPSAPGGRARPDGSRLDGANKPAAADVTALRGLVVRKSLEPAYTQLALNAASGPLADERVRRAIARAVDRKALAEYVLTPLGLPAVPPGSHLLVPGQPGYEDNSDAVGSVDPHAAMALLTDAGWKEGHGAGPAKKADGGGGVSGLGNGKGDDGDDDDGDGGDDQSNADAVADGKAGHDTAYDNGGKAGDAPARFKDGKKLVLRLLLPKGSGAEPLRAVGERIARQLDAIGVRTELVAVDDGGFFKDHIASGDFDLALYGWPTGPFPATEARPIFAKPQPAADGSLVVEQNYTRVGTDQIDRLFEEASTELDADAARDLVGRVDARIWAVAAALPLYQRPELVGARRTVVNAGAFGLASPRYQDIGFER